VLVLPSIQDGFGSVIVEAMGAGLPVVASANTGGPDVIESGRTGFVVPARSSEALAEALERLGRDPGTRLAMGAAAAEAMRRARTWEHFVDDMLARYAAARDGGRDHSVGEAARGAACGS
jgi:glycosyltransferase involved in cell wall biosynthesis